MRNNSSWVIAFLVGLVIFAFLVVGRSNRQNYWVARRAADQPAVIVQAPSEQVFQWRLHHWFER